MRSNLRTPSKNEESFRRSDKPVYVIATIVPQNGIVHALQEYPVFSTFYVELAGNRQIKVDYLLAPDHCLVE